MSGAVGFIGLGQIGAPMAGHLADWPGGLVVCDVRAEATDALAQQGAEVAATPADVARAADVISVMVRDDEQVHDVVEGPRGVLDAGREGVVLAVHSTIRPGTAEAVGAVCAERGVLFVDAPVSGGFIGAHEGTLAVMAGGDEDAVERCRPVFERWAKLVIRFGPVGAGTRAKLARNLITFASYAAAGEAQRLAEASGLELQDLAKVVRHSDGVTGGPGAIMFRETAVVMASGDPWRGIVEHTWALGDKDLDLALELGAALGIDLPMTAAARTNLAAALGLRHD